MNWKESVSVTKAALKRDVAAAAAYAAILLENEQRRLNMRGVDKSPPELKIALALMEKIKRNPARAWRMP